MDADGPQWRPVHVAVMVEHVMISTIMINNPEMKHGELQPPSAHFKIVHLIGGHWLTILQFRHLVIEIGIKFMLTTHQVVHLRLISNCTIYPPIMILEFSTFVTLKPRFQRPVRMDMLVHSLLAVKLFMDVVRTMVAQVVIV